MNSLSLLIYFAEFTDKFCTLLWIALGITFWLGGIVLIVWTIGWLVYISDNSRSKEDNPFKTRPYYGWWTITIATLVVIYSVIPSRDTMYLIAASEVGEVVVTSDYSKELLAEIQKTLKLKLQAIQGGILEDVVVPKEEDI